MNYWSSGGGGVDIQTLCRDLRVVKFFFTPSFWIWPRDLALVNASEHDVSKGMKCACAWAFGIALLHSGILP